MAAGRIPQPHRAVEARTGQPVAVRAERDTSNVSLARLQWSTNVGTPQPHGPVETVADQPVPIGAKGHTSHLLGVACQWVALGVSIRPTRNSAAARY